MLKRSVSLVGVLLTLIVPPVAAQTTYEPFLSLGGGWGIDPVVLDAGTQVFFDTGSDDPGELDLFSDGKLGIKLDLIGVDFAWMNGRKNLRTGINTAMGIAAATQTVPVTATAEPGQGGTTVVASLTYFVELGQLLKWHVGWVNGWSASETIAGRDDMALMVGLSFSTGLGKRIVGIFKEPEAP